MWIYMTIFLYVVASIITTVLTISIKEYQYVLFLFTLEKDKLAAVNPVKPLKCAEFYDGCRKASIKKNKN